MRNVSAFVIAGGKSSRMGRDKAFLELGGQTLLARALDVVRTVSRNVRIVGDSTRFSSYGNVAEDEFKNRGPLGGIHAALKTTTSELNLMLAVDLPFVEATFLDYLILLAEAGSAMVTVPRAAGGWQPLCAVYRRKFCSVAEKALLGGNNRIDALFAGIEVRPVEDAELKQAGFSGVMFRNLNTPEEWQEAEILDRREPRTTQKGETPVQS